MPKKGKSSGRKNQSRAQLDRARLSGLKKLQRAGLYSGDTSRVTSQGSRALRRYADVLSGKASAIKVASPIGARKYKGQFRVSGRTVVIPKEPGERFYFSKTSREISSYRRDEGGRAYRRRILPDAAARAVEGTLPTGPQTLYAVPIGAPGNYRTFKTQAEMQKEMKKYETTRIVLDKPGAARRWGRRTVQGYEWHKYVETWEYLE